MVNICILGHGAYYELTLIASTPSGRHYTKSCHSGQTRLTKTLINTILLLGYMAKKEAKVDSEKVGFHKGSLATLSKEREELMRILQIVEQLMQMHVKELKTLGVDLVAEAKKNPTATKSQTKKLKGKKSLSSVLQ
jgi:hypothetical protein